MSDRTGSRPDRTAWLAVGGVLLAVLCCAAPALIAGGVLASVGGFISGGFVIGLGVLLAFIGLVIAVNRRSRSWSPDDGYAPTDAGDGRRKHR